MDAVKNETNSSKKGQKHKFDKRNGARLGKVEGKTTRQIRKTIRHNIQWLASKDCTDQFK